jgi:superfamily I DNA/RNA helicase
VIVAEDLTGAAVDEARRLVHDNGTVAVIAPAALIHELTEALASSGLPFGQLGEPVSVHAATSVKGLEFDAVVVVEPSAIAADAPKGLRLLYVALTRPTRHLTVIHRAPLPPALS